MGRPRKDGKKSKPPVRIGKARATGNGSRTWSVRAHGPTPTAPYGRVVYRNPTTGKQTTAVPGDDQTLDDMFDQIERALDQKVIVGRSTGEDGQAVIRNVKALLGLYLNWLTSLGRSQDYISNRRCLAGKWILPLIGDVLVSDWSPEDSLAVITAAREAGLSPSRVEDLGSTLAGMRATAQRKRAGGRWLSPDENPLEGVSYTRGGTVQGASRDYVEKRYRPATTSVEKAVAAAAELNVFAWMSTIIMIGAYCALRLGEQLGLRAVDIDLENRQIDINGVWKVAHKAEVRGDRRERWRHPLPKNKLRRTAPYPGRLHGLLVDACRQALGMSVDATEAEVIEAIAAERSRRAELRKDGDWARAEVPNDQEAWLFVDKSGVPPTKEAFNDAWHIVRDSVDWPRYIPYKNLRHHAALWWKSKGFAWELIADWDGHDVQTLLKYYVLPEEDGNEKARKILDEE